MSDELLKEIVEGSADDASSALGWYLNEHFHQDQHRPGTWRCVAPLVELLRSRSPVRAEVMKRIGELVPHKQFNDLTPESAFWKSDENKQSRRSVKAVKAARAELEHALNDDDFQLRCATAWTLSLLKPESEAALRARLAVETDERVRMSLLLALGGGPGDSDLERVLRATSPLDAASAAAFGRLLSAAPTPWLYFEKGMLPFVAGRALGRLGRDEPRAFELLMTARGIADARVKAGAVPRDWHPFQNVSETDDEHWAGRLAWPSNLILLGIDTLLAWLVFGDRRQGAPLRRAELDARQTELLPLLWKELKNPPRHGDAAIAAFVRGGSVLDEMLSVDSVTAPICEHVWGFCAEGDWSGFDAPKLDAFCRAALETLPAARSFELATSLLAEELPFLKVYCGPVIVKMFLGVATRERVLTFAKQMKTPRHHSHFKDQLGTLLLNEWLVSREVPPPELDSAVACLMDAPSPPMGKAQFVAWLTAFPPDRLARLAVGCMAFETYEPLCERAALSDAMLAAFIAPDCTWDSNEASGRLEFVDLEALRFAPLAGSRREVVESMLDPHVELTLTLANVGDDVHCELESGTSVTVRELTRTSLAPLLPELRVKGRRTVTLTGDVSAEVEYAAFLLLGELLKPVTVIDRNGVTLRTT